MKMNQIILIHNYFVRFQWTTMSLFFMLSMISLGKASKPVKEGIKLFPETESNNKSLLLSLKVENSDVFVNQYKNYNYVHFEAGSSVMCKMTTKETISKIIISPRKDLVSTKISGKNAEFRLPKPGYYVVRINEKYKLFIFVEVPEVAPSKDVINIHDSGIDNKGIKNETKAIQNALNLVSGTGKVLLFPAGIYRTGTLNISGNTKIYLSAGAILKATDDINDFEPASNLKSKGLILIKDVKNVEIRGRGVIDGNGRLLRDKFGDAARMRILLMVNSSNVTIDGIIVRDPGSWNTHILKSEDVTIRNVKMMNDVELANTDGFDPDASKRVLIEHCFAFCSDDNIAIKTTNTSGYMQDVDGITVRGCVFLTRKSSLKVGTETRGAVMKNILFEDNDVVESDRGMALYCSDGALFQNIRFINNRFEDNYPDAKQCGIHFTINKRNSGSSIGQMKEILIKDCTFYNSFPKYSAIVGFDEGHRIQMTVENLIIAEKKCTTVLDARIDPNGFTDITIK
jgi:hypothetical protein